MAAVFCVGAFVVLWGVARRGWLRAGEHRALRAAAVATGAGAGAGAHLLLADAIWNQGMCRLSEHVHVCVSPPRAPARRAREFIPAVWCPSGGRSGPTQAHRPLIQGLQHSCSCFGAPHDLIHGVRSSTGASPARAPPPQCHKRLQTATQGVAILGNTGARH